MTLDQTEGHYAGFIGFELPWPPSSNRLWRFVPGQRTPLKSAEYRKWLIEAGRRVGPVATIQGPYRLLLEAARPDKRRRDLGNLEKPVSDLLQSCGVVADDCNAQEITLRWASGQIANGLIRVWVKPCET